MKLRNIGIGLIIIGLATAGVVTYLNSQKRQEPLVFSENAMLDNLWAQYKDEYVEEGTGRTIDKQRNNITTSEGQSYTMLRAVWEDDRATFDQSWQWTKDNLQHDNDKLFSWLFGQRADGSYGILEDQGGNNTAADGDTDLALALTYAYGRWGNDGYLADAKAVVGDIWRLEVVDVAGKPVVASNNQEKGDKQQYVINPSYFAPYAYRTFAQIDPSNNWLGAVDSSYEILDKSTTANLDKGQSAGLPPDWIQVDKTSGAVSPPVSGQTTNYGYDAIRVPFRVALDQKWNDEPRAKAYLEKLKFLGDQWSQDRKLMATYTHDGQPVDNYEAPAAYGTALGYFEVINAAQADQVYQDKLKLLYNPDDRKWKENLSYYDSNWAWFGLALHENALPNLAKGIK
jgi:endoglucanase